MSLHERTNRIAPALGIAGLALILLAGAAWGSEWHVTPGACMPDDANHGLSRLVTHWNFFTDGAATFLAPETGTIVLRCNITNPEDDGGDPGWDTVEAALVDTSASDANFVQAAIRRVNKLTGSVATELVIDSNEVDPTGSGYIHLSEPIGTDWNFEGNAYFLEIQLRRTTTGPTEKLLFVGLN